jgi:F-type H+-transporting ATPase subunit a
MFNFVETAFNQGIRAIQLLVILGMAVFAVPAHASGEPVAGEKEEKFRAGEMIMHHIADAHQIHIIGDLQIPLPVILYTDKGLDIFSSSVFWDEDHGTTKTYTSASTGYTYANEHETIVFAHEEHSGHGIEKLADSLSIASDSLSTVHGSLATTVAPPADSHTAEQGHTLVDFSITKTVAGMFLVIILLILIFRSVANAYKRRPGQAPRGFQNVVEPFILFVRNEVAIPSIGKRKADKFVPFLLTVFFFIWMSNMLGLVPFLGGFNITGTLSVTLVLALIVFLITSFNGNGHYWGHIFWPPGIPIGIKLILVPIEILSVFIKPTVLMIRLTANITAGHIIILAFVSLVLLFGQTSAVAGYSVGVGAVVFMVFMFFIELLVAFLQAYVFTLLAALYFGDATQEHHHDDHH